MPYNRFDRWGIIVYTVKEAEDKNIRVGHTLLQKLIYLLQEGFNVPLGYEFKLHHFGPYSEYLWGEITSLRDYDFLKIETDPDGYGYNIMSGQETEWIKSKDENVPKDKINSILEIFKGRFTKDLELFATTHYIYKNCQKAGLTDEDKIISQVIEIKSHFNRPQVKHALTFLRDKKLI